MGRPCETASEGSVGECAAIRLNVRQAGIPTPRCLGWRFRSRSVPPAVRTAGAVARISNACCRLRFAREACGNTPRRR